MAGIWYEHFLDTLKDLYITKKYADVKIKITEESESNECIWKTIEAHAVILDMNSNYFQEKLVNHKGGSSELEITLEAGETRYMVIILAAFYNDKVLKDLNVFDLLNVLELAKTFGNEVFMKRVHEHLEEMEVDDNLLSEVCAKIWAYETEDNQINVDMIVKLKWKYTSYLAKMFSPIEEKCNGHRTFMAMEYYSLFYLLQSNEIFSISENSLMIFIVLWLKQDSNRQTASIIKGLLQNIRVKYLSTDFLFSVIKKDNTILNKWEGFRDWLLDNLGILGISESARRISHPTVDQQVTRNVQGGIHSWYQNATNTQLNACRWVVRMTPEKPGEQFGPTEHFLVHDGFQFSPKSINITPIEGDETKLNMNLYISCAGLLENVRFVVGIVPANYDYDITNKYFGSLFAHFHLKLTDPLTFNSDVQIIELWTINKDGIDHVNEHGMYVFLLPMTDGEYQKLSIMSLRCGYGLNQNFSFKGKCGGGCGAYATASYKSDKIIFQKCSPHYK